MFFLSTKLDIDFWFLIDIDIYTYQHDETTRRHNQQIEQKREKAIELSMLRHYRTTDVAPKHNPYEKKKMCSLCAVMVGSNPYQINPACVVWINL